MAEDLPETETVVDGIDPGLGNVLFDVWLVSRAVHALIDETICETGLDADEFAIYSVLASGESMTPSELAGWMAAPPTTVSSSIKRLQKRGHVQRVPNPDDGRSYRIELTAAGKAVHRAAGALFQPLRDRVSEALGTKADDSRAQLLELRRVIDDIASD